MNTTLNGQLLTWSDWELWAQNAGAALFGGLWSSVAAGVVAPETFNFTHAGLIKLAELAVAGAVLGIAAFLKQSPLPSPEVKAAAVAAHARLNPPKVL